ncbi:unnamed protein product, partial [Sphenostylis stenocarpa]
DSSITWINQNYLELKTAIPYWPLQLRLWTAANHKFTFFPFSLSNIHFHDAQDTFNTLDYK